MGGALACQKPCQKPETEKYEDDVDIPPTELNGSSAFANPVVAAASSASAVKAVAAALASLEEDEKKNAAQFASDPSFLGALKQVLGKDDLSLVERDAAAIVVRTLAKRSVPFKRLFREAAGLEPLVAFLAHCTTKSSPRKSSEDMAEIAEACLRTAWAVANLAVDEPLSKDALGKLGVVPLLLAILNQALAQPQHFGDAAERAAQALDTLALHHPENQEAIVLAEGAEPLLNILIDQRVSGKVHLRAAFATYRLAQHPSNGVPLLDAGAEAILAKAVMSGADGMGHSDGVVAAAAALALLPEKVEQQGATPEKAEFSDDGLITLVLDNLKHKLRDDDPTRVMRLRDFTSACRMLSGKLSKESVDSFAKMAAPIFVQLLEKAGDWAAGGGKTAAEYAALCQGDIAGCVVQLVCAGTPAAAHSLRDGGPLLAALEKHTSAGDLRLRDAARSARYKLRQATEDALETPGAGKSGGGKKYDLFLSHKQSDAKDFVRALHTMLTVHGYKCFLDVEFDGELGSLAEIVSQSEQVLFVLTDKVLESPWCIMELTAAVEHGVPVTVIKKEGARWIEPDSGVRSLNFPSYAELNRLPEEIRPIFQIKIVEHSDTYYASFIEKLFERIETPGADGEEKEAAVVAKQSTKNSRRSSHNRQTTRLRTLSDDAEAAPDMKAVMDQLQNIENKLSERSGASVGKFINGLVVGAFLVVVSIAVVFTIYNFDSAHRWDAFLVGLLIGTTATAIVSLTAYARGRSAKAIAEPNPEGGPGQLEVV